jgi:hypothetical protein
MSGGQPVPLTALIMRALRSVVETSPALVEDLAQEALHARLLAAVEARKLAAPEGEVSGIHQKFPSKLTSDLKERDDPAAARSSPTTSQPRT